jgi:hypothetical protein
MLLINGSADVRVNPGNAKRLAEKLQQLGTRAELKIYDGINHTQLVLSLAGVFRWLAPTLNDSADFIDRIANQKTN